MDPFVSVIIPAKNEEENIARCIQHINYQQRDKSKIEIIVVDNGSTDRTIEIAQSLGVKVLKDSRGTISELRNLGVKTSNGEIVAFVDADVFVGKNWLMSAIRCFEETDAVCVGCSPRIPDESTWVERAWHYQIAARPNRHERNWLVSMNMLVRKDVFVAIDGFNPMLVTCEDVDFGYRVSKKGSIIFDKSIEAVHVGEAKTLVGLFLKESWRGIGNFEGIIQHGILFKELSSHFSALYFFIMYPVLLYQIMFGQTEVIVIVIFSTMIIPLLKTVSLVRFPIGTVVLVQIFCVWWVYCWARGYSGIRFFALKLIHLMRKH
jgi:glycosyltransferase involved in cell wall biosynthesis